VTHLRKHGIILLLLALSCVVIFQRGVTNTYIEIDDPKHIFENPLLNPPSVGNVAKFWEKPFFGMYIPVTYTVWSLIAVVAGRSPSDPRFLSAVLFHALNVLLHVLNTYLVYLLLRRLLPESDEEPDPAIAASVAGALLFAWHPLQVESVAWVSGIKDILSASFALAALHLWLDRRWRWGMLAFLGSLLSKPGSVALPFIFLVLAPFRLKKRERHELLVGAMLVLVPIALITMNVQAVVSDRTKVEWFLRPLVLFDSLGFYVNKLFWPTGLAFDYGRHPASLKEGNWIYFAWIFPTALAAAAYGLRRRLPWLGQGLAVAALALLPVTGIIPFQFQVFSTVADHYAYFALTGISLLAAHALYPFKWAWPAAPLLLVWAVLSYGQIPVWGDNERLFSQSISVNPRSLISRTNLGFSYMMKHRPQDAVEHFRVSVELEPEVVDLRVNLGMSLLESGRVEEAIPEMRKAVELAPQNRNAHYALGQALVAAGRVSEGQRHLATADRLGSPKN